MNELALIHLLNLFDISAFKYTTFFSQMLAENCNTLCRLITFSLVLARNKKPVPLYLPLKTGFKINNQSTKTYCKYSIDNKHQSFHKSDSTTHFEFLLRLFYFFKLFSNLGIYSVLVSFLLASDPFSPIFSSVPR